MLYELFQSQGFYIPFFNFSSLQVFGVDGVDNCLFYDKIFIPTKVRSSLLFEYSK